MLSIEEMPEDNADLARVAVDFPLLDPNSAESCPASMPEIVEYLRLESPDGEDVQTGQLRFRRTAQVAELRYWIWSFQESDGSECYVTVSVGPDGMVTTGYAENHHKLSPEQFMLGEYHQVF